MRRDIWLAGVAGAIVGSWLTLVAVQFSEHGFSLPHRSGGTSAETKHTTAPTETAKTDTPPQKAADTATQGDTPPAGQPSSTSETAKDKATAPAASSPSTSEPGNGSDLSAIAMAAAAAATTAPSIDDKAKGGSDAGTEDGKTPAADPAASQAGKLPTDPARSEDTSTKPENAAATAADIAKRADGNAAGTSQPTTTTSDTASPAASETAPADQAKTDPVTDNRIPADQIDRETAAITHQTLTVQTPPQLQPQAQPKPQSEQAALDPASKPDGQTTIELVRPFADQAGILTLAGRSVLLNGIIPTDVDRMCIGPNGKSWPCGQAARTAFRMYLRGRSIDCDVPDANWKGTVKGACRYVRIDLSAWLVRFGWADPEPGSPLAALVDEAKEKKRGMYGDDPRKGGKSTLAPPPAKEDPLNPI
ncbi:MAG: hypothetical protein E6Q77_12260 [Rhizobium sp.]|nr:MAG: hypothetical protein E6Q77_12260 [Rhizobium sp.]